MRLHIAGQDGVLAVTAAHADGQGVGAAQGGHAIVVDLNRQEIHVLGHPAEPLSGHVYAGCAVCEDGGQWGLMK